MNTKKVKFISLPGIPRFENIYGSWTDGTIKEIPADNAERLCARFPDIFAIVEEINDTEKSDTDKEFIAPRDKMIRPKSRK